MGHLLCVFAREVSFYIEVPVVVTVKPIKESIACSSGKIPKAALASFRLVMLDSLDAAFQSKVSHVVFVGL